MLNQNLDLARNKMEQTLSFVDSELSKIRTGRANPDMFNKILINYYDNETPLNQIANISLLDGVTISIQPFDKTFIDDIERAIVESDLGLNPSNNGNSIVISFPPLSTERREELVKFASQIVEEGRVSVRNIRRDTIQAVKKIEKEEKIPEDDIRQVKRWINFAGSKGRWKLRLISNIIINNSDFDDINISPVIRQGLQHWGYKLTKKDFEDVKWRSDF